MPIAFPVSLWFLLAAITWLVDDAHAQQTASFACEGVRQPFAVVVCSDAELSGLDAVMGERYKVLRDSRSGPPQLELIDNQLNWFAQIKAQCGVPETPPVAANSLPTAAAQCLRGLYQKRLASFEGDQWRDSRAQFESTLPEETRKQLQQRMTEQGYYSDKVDGRFGPKFRKALAAAQRGFGLPPDGFVDEKLVRKLGIQVRAPEMISASQPATPPPALPSPTLTNSGTSQASAMRQVVQMGHVGSVDNVVISPDGRLAFSVSSDGNIKLWDLNTGREIRTIELPEGAELLGFSMIKNNLIYLNFPEGDNNNSRMRMEVWDAATSQKLGDSYFPGFTHGFDPEQVSGSLKNDRFELESNDEWSGPIKVSIVDRITKNKVHTLTIKGPVDGFITSHISPDGGVLVAHETVLGSKGRRIAFWNTVNGHLIGKFNSNYSQPLAFSPDSKWLLAASCSYGGSGSDYDCGKTVSVRSMDTGQELKQLRTQLSLRNKAVISPNGQLAIMLDHGASWHGDGDCELWDITIGKRLHRFSTLTESIAFSPDSQTILSGNADGSIKLMDVSSGREIRTLGGQVAAVSSVAISADGKSALTGSYDYKVGRGSSLKLWDLTTGRMIRGFTGSSGMPGFVALSPDGKQAYSKQAWITCAHSGCGISNEELDDSPHVEVPTTLQKSKIFQVIPWFSEMDNKSPTAWDIWDVATGKHIKKLKDHDGHPSWMPAWMKGAKSLELVNQDIAIVKAIRASTKDDILSVQRTPDGRLAVSAGSDGTRRVWDVASGQEIVKMISTTDGEWVTVTPDGYYDSSPEGKEMIHYATDTETFGFEQFESLFRRPDIIRARLAGDLKAGTPAPALTRPPQVQILPTRGLSSTTAGSYPLALTVASRDDLVKTLRVFVNGKPSVEVPVEAKDKRLNLDVPLFAGPNRITAVAYDSKGFSSNQESIDVVSNVPGASKPTLFVLSIGVSAYPKMASKWQLDYAHSDAEALVKTLRGQRDKVFQDVRDLTLSNQQATPSAIREGMEALSTMNANDIAVIFLAGHGVQGKDGRFWFVTPEGSLEQPELGGLDWALLSEQIKRIKGRVVLLLDACHSGSLVDETIAPNDELAARFFKGGTGGVMVFSASKGRQQSLESPDIGGGSGFFTYALRQALGPKEKEADRDGNGYVEFMELVDYVSKTVNSDTQGAQTPWLSRRELFGDLAMAVSKGGG